MNYRGRQKPQQQVCSLWTGSSRKYEGSTLPLCNCDTTNQGNVWRRHHWWLLCNCQSSQLRHQLMTQAAREGGMWGDFLAKETTQHDQPTCLNDNKRPRHHKSIMLMTSRGVETGMDWSRTTDQAVDGRRRTGVKSDCHSSTSRRQEWSQIGSACSVRFSTIYPIKNSQDCSKNTRTLYFIFCWCWSLCDFFFYLFC